MTMNSNAAVFGICSAAESGGGGGGYGSPQPYPTPEQLSAFYSSGGGGGGSGGDTPPLTYHGGGGIHPAESRTGGGSVGGVIETKSHFAFADGGDYSLGQRPAVRQSRRR